MSASNHNRFSRQEGLVPRERLAGLAISVIGVGANSKLPLKLSSAVFINCNLTDDTVF